MFIYRTVSDTEPHITLSPAVVKFPEDCFLRDGDPIIACEGFLLNARELREKYGKEDNASLIEYLYRTDPESLYDCFKGSYVIAIYDKTSGVLTVINDLLSKRTVYYLRNKGSKIALAVSTSFLDLCDLLRENGEKLTVSSEGVMSMLNNRQMLFDVTYAEETGYLMPFERLEISGEGGVSVGRLPLPETDSSITAEQAVEEMDRLFLEGCRLQLDKNIEGGYITAMSLSGGMDSRALFLSAKRLGYHPDLCFTYAQSGSLDETVPQQIACDHGCKHIFHALDRGNFIAERDIPINANEGQLIYCGTTGLSGVLSALDCGKIGILHCGIGGGEIMGDILSAVTKQQEPEFYRKRAATLSLPGKGADPGTVERMMNSYNSYHQFANLNDTRLCVNFARTASRCAEASSPFLYEDFFRYLLKVPSELKRSRKLYIKWYVDKMPNSYPTTFSIRLDRLESKAGFVKRKLHHKYVLRRSAKTNGHTRYDMNPFSRWESENRSITEAVAGYFEDDMKKLGGLIAPELASAMRQYMEKDLVSKASAATASWTLCRMLLGK